MTKKVLKSGKLYVSAVAGDDRQLFVVEREFLVTIAIYRGSHWEPLFAVSRVGYYDVIEATDQILDKVCREWRATVSVIHWLREVQELYLLPSSEQLRCFMAASRAGWSPR